MVSIVALISSFGAAVKEHKVLVKAPKEGYEVLTDGVETWCYVTDQALFDQHLKAQHEAILKEHGLDRKERSKKS